MLLERIRWRNELGGGMNNKIYLVNFYVDFECHGVEAVFKNKEDAVKYTEYAKGPESDGFVSYDISEEILYESYQALLEVAE